jgi:hypothetical protein
LMSSQGRASWLGLQLAQDGSISHTALVGRGKSAANEWESRCRNLVNAWSTGVSHYR